MKCKKILAPLLPYPIQSMKDHLKKSINACHVLTNIFSDIQFIEQESSSLRGLEYQYYSLNRPWAYPPMAYQKFQFLNSPKLIMTIFSTKRKDNYTKTYFTMIKFGNVHSNLQFSSRMVKRLVGHFWNQPKHGGRYYHKKRICSTCSSLQIMNEQQMLEIFIS
jgi:hypothetical protein